MTTPDPESRVWITADGRVLPIASLASPHLDNILHQLERNAVIQVPLAKAGEHAPPLYWRQLLPQIYFALQEEHQRRHQGHPVERRSDQ